MIRPVLLYTDPLLHKPCAKIEEITDEIRTLAEDMVETMQAYDGVGLAGNQIGVPKNICVMYVENHSRILILINPVLKLISKERIKMLEGCLSCPGLTVKVKRPKKVVIEAQLLTGEEVTLQFTDFDSRIVCHELAHLQGHILSNTTLNFTRFK
jgi:peptide deformylase